MGKAQGPELQEPFHLTTTSAHTSNNIPTSNRQRPISPCFYKTAGTFHMAPGAIEIQAEILSSSPSDLSITPPSTDPVPFGSEDGWLYLPSCKRFDLSRGASTKLVIDADDGVRHHRGCMIDPAKTVLVRMIPRPSSSVLLPHKVIIHG